jgi:hypothetical protein
VALEPLAGDDPVEVAGYRLRARLGSGGMGRVYLAFTAGGRAVALKVVRPELGEDEEFRSRFRQEVAAARRVHGLYTAQVLDADPDAVQPWLVTAYVPGPSLQQAVAGHGPMPVLTVVLLMAGVAEALQAIHAAGVVHRDLKPSNVLLAADGPRVIDFGIARAVDATAVTRTGMRVGSPQFMAPEQVAGLAVSPAMDVFALGSLAAYAVLGRPVFGEGPATAVMYRILHEAPDLGECPPALRGIIERCLAKQAAQRPLPAEIISECRAHTVGQTLQIAQAWLPAAVAADLAQHAPPAGIVPGVPGGPDVAGVPGGPDVAGGLGAAGRLGTVGAAWPDQHVPPLPAATATVTPVRQSGGAWQDARKPSARKPSTRKTAIVGVAALVLAAGTGAGVLMLLRPGGTLGSPRHGATAAAVTGSRRTASRGSARPTPTSALDSCLVGTWRSETEDLINIINGNSIQFTGSGAVATFRPDGTVVTDYGNGTALMATVNGGEWTDVFRGAATGHWDTQNGTLLFSGISAHGSWTLEYNGAYNNGGPLSVEPGPVPYKCSGNTLREFFADGSSVLSRLPAARPTVTPAGS